MKKFLKLCWKKPSPKVDKNGNVAVTAVFTRSMQFLFDKCDEDSIKEGGPFSTNTRSLLVHSILNSMDFHSEKKRNQIIEGLKKNKDISQSSENGLISNQDKADQDSYNIGGII